MTEYEKKMSIARQAIDGDVIRSILIACCVTNSADIHNVYCFYTATVVTRTHLSVMLYLHCLSYLVNYR